MNRPIIAFSMGDYEANFKKKNAFWKDVDQRAKVDKELSNIKGKQDKRIGKAYKKMSNADKRAFRRKKFDVGVNKIYNKYDKAKASIRKGAVGLAAGAKRNPLLYGAGAAGTLGGGGYLAYKALKKRERD